MPNYIRANFCSQKIMDGQSIEKIIKRLKLLGCIFAKEPFESDGGWYHLEFFLSYNNINWDMKIIKWRLENCSQVYYSLDIDDNFFLPPGIICYTPKDDPKFIHYINIINEFIQEIDPVIGIIDYEADLSIWDLEKEQFIVWGLFLSRKLHEKIDNSQIEFLFSLSREVIKTQSKGFLLFNHPLGIRDNNPNLTKVSKIIQESLKKL